MWFSVYSILQALSLLFDSLSDRFLTEASSLFFPGCLMFVPRSLLVSSSCTTRTATSIYIHVCTVKHDIYCSKSMDQPGKVANPASGQLDRENDYFPVRVRA